MGWNQDCATLPAIASDAVDEALETQAKTHNGGAAARGGPLSLLGMGNDFFGRSVARTSRTKTTKQYESDARIRRAILEAEGDG